MFLSADIKAEAHGGPGGDFWFQPVSPATASGSIVTSDTALRLSTVYKCVKVLAETIGMLPCHFYRRGDQRQRVEDHPLHTIFSRRPNRWQTPMQFVSMLEAHRALRGNGYAEIFWGRNGNVEELVPVHPDRVTPEVASNGLPRWRVRPVEGSGQPERVLVPGEMLHLMGMSMDGYTGINPIQAEREAIGSAIAARDYGSRFWANDARPPFWIKVPGKFENNEARAAFRDEWQAAYGGAHRGRPAAMDRGMELVALDVANSDAEWMASRKYSDLDICGLFRMPPHKIGILSEAKYANIEQQAIEFVTDTLMPLLVSWEQTILRDLLPDDGDVYPEFLTEHLLRGDTKNRFEAYGKGISDGWLTRNEVRKMENRAPLPGLDEPLQPLNMASAGRAALGAPSAPPPGRAQQDDGAPLAGAPALPAPESAARAVALLQASAERVVRKELALLRAFATRADRGPIAAVFEKHAAFVAEVMAVGQPDAEAYTAQVVQRAARAFEANATPLPESDWRDTQIAALMRLGS